MLIKILRVLLFLTPAVLLVVPSHMFFPFISGKNLIFRLLVEIIFGLYLFLIFRHKEYRPQKTPMLVACSVFICAVFLSDLLSPNFSKAFWSNFERSEGFVTLLHLFGYFVILGTVLRTKELWNKFFAASLSVSVALNLFGWLQYIGGAQVNQSTTRFDSLMGNSAYFAGFLMFQIFIFLFLLKREKNNVKYFSWILFVGSTLFSLVYIFGGVYSAQAKHFVLASFVGATAVLVLSYLLKDKYQKILFYVISLSILISHILLTYFTQTRGALLGLIGGVLLTSLVIVFLEKNKVLRNSALTILLFVCFLVVGFLSIKNTDFVRKDPILNRFAEISWSERNTQARQIIWPMAFEGVKEKPLFGWGQEGFSYIFAKHYNPELWRHEAWFDRTHNVFIDWFVASGFFGLLSYLALYIVGVVIVVKKVLKESVTEGAILLGLFSAYAFQNMFIFDNIGSYILFFSLLGFLYTESRQEKQIEVSQAPKRKVNEEEVSPVFIALGSGLFTVFIMYHFVCIPYMQNALIIEGISPQPKGPVENLKIFEKAFSYGGPGVEEAREQFYTISEKVINLKDFDMSTKVAFFELAQKQLNLQLVETPLEPKPIFVQGVFLGQIGQLDLSLKYLEEALKLSPHKVHILNQIGLVYLVKNEGGKAFPYLEKSYTLAPDFSDSAMLYSAALLLTGKKGESLSIVEKFAQKGVPPIPFLIDQFLNAGLRKELFNFVEIARKVNPSPRNSELLKNLTK